MGVYWLYIFVHILNLLQFTREQLLAVLTGQMGDDDKPFACIEPGCGNVSTIHKKYGNQGKS